MRKKQRKERGGNVACVGESPVDITPGQVVSLPAGAVHTFTNTGDVTATLIEVFGK